MNLYMVTRSLGDGGLQMTFYSFEHCRLDGDGDAGMMGKDYGTPPQKFIQSKSLRR